MGENANGEENERQSEAAPDEQDGEESERLEDVTVMTTGDRLLGMLRRCEAGESADLVLAEIWANAEHVQ